MVTLCKGQNGTQSRCRQRFRARPTDRPSSSSDTLLIKRTCAVGASAAGAASASCAVSVSRFLRSSGGGGEEVGHFEET